jgi:DNA-binding NtrC family response regulator
MSGNSMGKVLIVDDEPNAVKVLSAILSECGYKVVESLDASSAIKLAAKEDVDAVITDLKMPGKDGIQLFDYMAENFPDVPVIFLTAYGSVETAVDAVTKGAFYYFIKPPDYHKLKSILDRAVEQRRLKREVEVLRKRLEEESQYRITGKTSKILKILETVEAIKNSASSILICGDTGTGKEMIARAIHYKSLRNKMPFVAVNCAAIPRELMEAELFGYVKGAFTGAVSLRIGRFEEASEGTVFLDEIGELDLSLQAKLLRVLEEREIERLGSNTHLKVNFKLISSTNRDLRREVETGNFREDLFYRINVVQLNVPSLVDRRDDIPLLVSELLMEVCIREDKMLNVSDEVMTIFKNYPWPGNIRQLRNVIERAVILAKGDTITPVELSDEFLLYKRMPQVPISVKPLREVQKQAIKEALRECNGNKSKAARMLGISRKAFYKRLGEGMSA